MRACHGLERLKLLKNITSRSRGNYSFNFLCFELELCICELKLNLVENSSRFPRLRYTLEMTTDILGLTIILRRGFSIARRHLVQRWSLCFACLAWFNELFVGMLKWLTNAYDGCGGPTLNFIERFDLDRSVPTAKTLHLASVGRSSNRMYRLCTDYVQIMSNCRTVNLKMFCIILCATSKASENRTFVLKQSNSFECFCCHHDLFSGCHEDHWDCRTNCIRFISKLWCAWGNKCNDPEVDLNVDAVDRSHCEWLYCFCSNLCKRKYVFEDVRESPFEWPVPSKELSHVNLTD